MLTLVASSSGSSGVAKSLTLIDHSVGDRSVVRVELDAKDRLLTPLYERTRKIAVALSSSGTADRLARQLDKAGNPAPWTVERIMGAKGATLLLGALLGVIYGGFSLRGLLFAGALGAAFLFLPDLLLYNVSLHRQDDTAKGLAEALDMLTICVEAGQGFDAALSHVARTVEGPISGEFARMLSEIQIGKSRAEAFAALGERVTLPEVKNFTTALVQADRLGLPIGNVLREQTSVMRVVVTPPLYWPEVSMVRCCQFTRVEPLTGPPKTPQGVSRFKRSTAFDLMPPVELTVGDVGDRWRTGRTAAAPISRLGGRPPGDRPARRSHCYPGYRARTGPDPAPPPSGQVEAG